MEIMDHSCSYSTGCKFDYNEKESTYTCLSSKQVHICTNDTCNRTTVHDGIFVCNVSGRCYDATRMAKGYRNHVRQNKHTPPPVDKRSKHKGLLFDPSETGLLIQSKISKRKKNGSKRQSDRWINPYSVHILIKKILQIKENTCPKSTTIKIIERPSDHLSVYSNIAIKVWNILINERPPRCTFDDFIIGFIFKIKFGLEMDDKIICKPNTFLQEHFPHINILVNKGFLKKSLRLGTNYFMSTIRDIWIKSPIIVINTFKDYNKITGDGR